MTSSPSPDRGVTDRAADAIAEVIDYSGSLPSGESSRLARSRNVAMRLDREGLLAHPDDEVSVAYLERMAADHEAAAVHLLASPHRAGGAAQDEARLREGVAENLRALAAWLRTRPIVQQAPSTSVSDPQNEEQWVSRAMSAESGLAAAREREAGLRDAVRALADGALRALADKWDRDNLRADDETTKDGTQ